MLSNRADPRNVFDVVPALEMELELVLVQLDRLLEDDRLLQTIKTDSPSVLPRSGHRAPFHALRMSPAPLGVRHLYG
jgi:hypothetical protein